MESYLTLLIIGVTVLTSINAFNNPASRDKMLFNPYLIRNNKEYSRFLSSGLIHADYMHLIFNMYTLYIFGELCEPTYKVYFGKLGGLIFLLFYVSALIVSHTISFFKNKDNPYYNSLGASGAVAAIVFSVIMIYPISGKIWGIPSVIVGILYLMYSQYMSEKNMDNVGHDAHFAGAIYGILFTIAIRPAFAVEFIRKLLAWQ